MHVSQHRTTSGLDGTGAGRASALQGTAAKVQPPTVAERRVRARAGVTSTTQDLACKTSACLTAIENASTLLERATIAVTGEEGTHTEQTSFQDIETLPSQEKPKK